MLHPGATTQWGSQYYEAKQTKILMGDIFDAIDRIKLQVKWKMLKCWANLAKSKYIHIYFEHLFIHTLSVLN